MLRRLQDRKGAAEKLWQPRSAAYLVEAGEPAEPRQQKVRPPTAAQASAGRQQPRQKRCPAAQRLRVARPRQGDSAAAGCAATARQVEQGWGEAPLAPAAPCCQMVMRVQAAAGSQAPACPAHSLGGPSPAAPARQMGRRPLPAHPPVQAGQPVQPLPLAAAEAPSPAAPARRKVRRQAQRWPAAAGPEGPPEQLLLGPVPLLQQAQPLRLQAVAVPGAGASRPEGVSECR